jgi:hypothetical protein
MFKTALCVWFGHNFHYFEVAKRWYQHGDRTRIRSDKLGMIINGNAEKNSQF